MSPTIAILSPGSMGEAIARLLHAHDYATTTNVSARSVATQARATSAHMHLHSTDLDLAATADYVLSIVPPRDALATAQRIVTAIHDPAYGVRRAAANKREDQQLVYLDLNAISPRLARTIAALFEREVRGRVMFVDGGIIGAPPSPLVPSPPATDDARPDTTGIDEGSSWKRPRIPLSGPWHRDNDVDARLARVLNARLVGPEVGSASGLKMCFAALTKGFTALAIQSCTTAWNLGVLDELRKDLEAVHPSGLKTVEGSLPGMPPKAYRWVREMEEIADTFEEDGGFDREESMFRGVARTYELVADGTELGRETTEDRKNGKTVDDVARLMSEGTAKRKVKED